MIEKYGVDYESLPPTKEQLEQLKESKVKPVTMKQANEMIDELAEKEKKIEKNSRDN